MTLIRVRERFVMLFTAPQDASVVMVENIHRHLSESEAMGSVKWSTIKAAKEVSKPILFSTAIIVAAFIPLFTMSGVEGKVFGPMALTYGFALLGALILALTLSPVLSSLVLKRQHGEHETFFVRGILESSKHQL